MKIKRAFIKGTNWALAGLIGLLGFSNCIDERLEYGTPHADYTVKGTVVDKATGKPIPGILVSYEQTAMMLMYGVPQTTYKPKASVSTNARGEYTLKDGFSIGEMIPDDKNTPTYIPVYVKDVDGETNGWYSDTTLNVNVKNAVHSGKSKGWYEGEYTINVNVELTERKDNE